MFSPRLIAVLTALSLMAGATPGHAEYTLVQLQEIERLISEKNSAGLWAYLKSNPDILVGTDPLANELRNFVSNTERGQLSFFAARSAPVDREGAAPVTREPPAVAIY